MANCPDHRGLPVVAKVLIVLMVFSGTLDSDGPQRSQIVLMYAIIGACKPSAVKHLHASASISSNVHAALKGKAPDLILSVRCVALEPIPFQQLKQ